MRLHHFIVLALSLCGCLSELAPEVGPVIAGQCKKEDSDPELDVSFKDEVLPMLAMRCGCHDPKGSGSAIDSTAFSVGARREVLRGGNKSSDKAVIAGDACNSVLVQKVGDAPPFGAVSSMSPVPVRIFAPAAMLMSVPAANSSVAESPSRSVKRSNSVPVSPVVPKPSEIVPVTS